MAQIVGGIGTSHSPRLAHVYDHGGQKDPAWAPIFDRLRAGEGLAKVHEPEIC